MMSYINYSDTMDIPWGSEESHKFVTNIGLITSNGPNGGNIMAAEWTRLVSYSPGLIAINLSPGEATLDNIQHTKHFGVNIAADDQFDIIVVAGRHTGWKVDKIGMLKDMEIEIYRGETIDVPMLKGTALNIEAKVVSELKVGDHIMFIGEVLKVSHNAHKKPIAYNGSMWKLTENVPRPSAEFSEKMEKLAGKHKKHSSSEKH